MSSPPPRRRVELSDPRALRAVAHPIRLALIGLLRTGGPLTATRAGELLGESAGSCSFHLRQLAKYGLAEEAGGGRGRERPWRATSLYTSWPRVSEGPELAAASAQLKRVVAENWFDKLMEWVASQENEPVEWQEAAQFGDSLLYLTPDELAELGREADALVERYLSRTADRTQRPPGSRPVVVLSVAFPRPLDAPEASP